MNAASPDEGIRSATWVWCALVLLVPYTFSGNIYEGALLPRLAVLQFALLLLLAGLAARLWRPGHARAAPLFLPLGLLLVFEAASTCLAVNRVESALQLSHYACLLAVPLVVHHTLDTRGLARVARYAAWAGLPIAFIGIAQYLGWPLPLLDRIPTSANPSATFFHRNAAAEYLIAVIPLACAGLWLARRPASAVWHGLLLIALGTFLVYTRARGAWLGISSAAALAAILAWRSRHSTVTNAVSRRLSTAALPALCILAVVAALASLPENIRRPGAQHFDEKKSDAVTALSSIVAEGGDRGRLRMWEHTWAMVRENPLGVGIGNWQYRFPEYARGDQVNVAASPSRPHNDYLWIAAEAGLPGLAAYLWLLLAAAWVVWTLLRNGSETARALTLAFAAVVIGHAVDACFNFPRERVSASLLFWFSLGGLSVLHAESMPGSPSRRPTRLRGLAVGLSIPLAAAALWITLRRLDYDRHHLQVYAAERRGDWPTVSREAEAALRHGVLRANTAIALGRALWRAGDLDGAERAYRSALARHPNSLNAYNNLATVLRQKGDPTGAVDALNRALELLPNFPEALNNLGLAYRDLGMFPDAIMVLRQAASALPNVPDVHCNLGDTYAMQRNWTAARESYLTALAVRPGYGRAQQALRRLDEIHTAHDERAAPVAP